MNIVIYPKTALRCLATLDLLRHYHVLLMTRETRDRVMASFAAELSQQIALVLPPLQDNNSKLHMYNCNVSLLTEVEGTTCRPQCRLSGTYNFPSCDIITPYNS